MEWQGIAESDIIHWQKKIHDAGASLFQFPSWLESFKEISFFKPRYFKLENSDGSWAYCGLLQVKLPFIKVGIISFGPIISANGNREAIIKSLLIFLKKQKFTFVRMPGITREMAAQPGIKAQYVKENTFPFYNDLLNNYVITKKENEEELKNSFNHSHRNAINKIIKNNLYEFIIDDEGKYFDEVYELFTNVGRQKNFKYRPKSSYKAMLANNEQLQFATFYIARLNDRVVNAILVIRDKHCSINMSGALDTTLINKRDSPAKFLHYFAMSHEFYKLGTGSYNFGYSDGPVGEFKSGFHPTQQLIEMPGTLVFNAPVYKLYAFFGLKHRKTLKKLAKKVVKKMHGK